MAKRTRDEVNTRVEELEDAPKRAEKPVQKRPMPATSPEQAPEPRQLTPVALRVFLTACGIKPVQTAGFAAYAQARQFGPRTMPEWRSAYDEFMRRPVK
jgi:hypothetical protein